MLSSLPILSYLLYGPRPQVFEASLQEKICQRKWIHWFYKLCISLLCCAVSLIKTLLSTSCFTHWVNYILYVKQEVDNKITRRGFTTSVIFRNFQRQQPQANNKVRTKIYPGDKLVVAHLQIHLWGTFDMLHPGVILICGRLAGDMNCCCVYYSVKKRD